MQSEKKDIIDHAINVQKMVKQDASPKDLHEAANNLNEAISALHATQYTPPDVEAERKRLFTALEGNTNYLLIGKNERTIFSVEAAGNKHGLRWSGKFLVSMWGVCGAMARATKVEVVADFENTMNHKYPPEIEASYQNPMFRPTPWPIPDWV